MEKTVIKKESHVMVLSKQEWNKYIKHRIQRNRKINQNDM